MLFKPCPIHCIDTEAWRKIAAMDPKKHKALWTEMCRYLGWERILRCTHDRHLCRIGGAQSFLETAEPRDKPSALQSFQDFGRWSNISSPMHYMRDSLRVPALVALKRWPVKIPGISSSNLSLDSIMRSLKFLNDWRK